MDLFPPAIGVRSVSSLSSLSSAPSAGLPRLEPEPEAMHPALWRASQMGRPGVSAFASGFAQLDAVLPGGGWPGGVLTELLHPHPGVGELRLLAPTLARLQAGPASGKPLAQQTQQAGCLMWFDPPAEPCAWALQALGLQLRQLVLVRSRPVLPGLPGLPGLPDRHAATGARASSASRKALRRAPDALWALEQALACGHVAAVLAWLPADALRRLQLAAQGHAGPVFLLRPESAK